jgi:diguanylate cyclase (GGDEF)-like protein
MTLFDLLIIGVFIYASMSCYHNTRTLRELGAYRPLLQIITGLGIFALFYLTDLIIMHLLPLFMSMTRSMEIMNELHLNYMWGTSLLGVVLIAIGLAQLIKVLLPQLAELLNNLQTIKQKLEHQAGTDALTSLPNRRQFYRQIGAMMANAKQQDAMFALLFLDLDNFKPINDEFGHEAGDEILLTVAQRLVDGLRHSDTVARFGGDEFVICLNSVRDQGAVTMTVQKLIARLTLPCTVQGQPLQIGVSIGISIFPEHGSQIDTLIRAADSAMYQAKESGGNQFSYFDATSRNTATQERRGPVRS